MPRHFYKSRYNARLVAARRHGPFRQTQAVAIEMEPALSAPRQNWLGKVFSFRLNRLSRSAG